MDGLTSQKIRSTNAINSSKVEHTSSVVLLLGAGKEEHRREATSRKASINSYAFEPITYLQ